MEETIERAKEELKRVDHLFYVSLKYTKTVDVIKSIIERMINAFECSIDALSLCLEKKKKSKQVPQNPIDKAIAIRDAFKEDNQIKNDINLYLLLRRLNRAEYTAAREFRKHVTMTAKLDNELMDINVEVIQGYFERAKNFIEKSYKIVHGIKDE
jgi:site-specific DNA-adenine methylase